MNIFGTGLSGLVGSRIVELLTPSFQFENASLDTGVDITDRSAISRAIKGTSASWVFHFAAYTNVQKSEEFRDAGERGLPWQVNVSATETIAALCRETKKHLLYLSTDYVFDGKKHSYSEEDRPHPLGWYAVTKYEGEKRVAALGPLGLVVRIANPYRANPVGKTDFVHKIKDLLGSGKPVPAPTDQLFMPTFIDDIAVALKHLILAEATGIYHVTGEDALSPYEGAWEIARTWGLSTDNIQKTTFVEFMKGRAPAPAHAVLLHDKIKKLGVSMRTFREGLREVKRQES